MQVTYAAVIVAAGSARRMGFDKLLAPLAGKPVLQWSIEAFLASECVEAVAVVTSEDRFAEVLPAAGKPVWRVDGGAERFLSVRRGLDSFPVAPTVVAVHDGARPLIRPGQIDSCLRAAAEWGAAALARRVTETLKRADHDLRTRESVERDDLWVMETPQAFRFETLQEAYREAERRDLHLTDDVSAVQTLGVATRLLENPHPNLKITVPQDLLVAEALLKAGGDSPVAP